ncbi:MAG: ATPase, partial [Phenylobacterium sp.]|nr:ATPase [Phenylobacterium sp.]
MARRGGEDAEAIRPQGRDNAPGVRALPTQTFARIAILSTLLLLAVYTAFAVARIQREPQITTAANAALPSRAEAVAAHLDAEAAALRGGLLAAREALQRDGNQPMAAAESGLRASAGAAVAIAVISDDEIVAI